jgi:hypothetical protein
VDTGNSSIQFRLSELERRATRLENLEPAVIRSQVEDVKKDVGQLAADMAAIRKILIGFLVTFAFTGITTVVAIVALTGRA